MGYVLGQYNHNQYTGDDEDYINLIKNGEANRRSGKQLFATTDSNAVTFEDECLKLNNLLSISSYYYFRCYIKQLSSDQTINIKLVNYNQEAGSTSSVEQYIKTIFIPKGEATKWIDIDCIFHPLVQFDTILLELERITEDYRDAPRYPKIAYQELGEIKNIINETKMGENVNKLLKIGVQGRPNLKMCINGEEIYSPKSGIYEIRNGVIPINFFSVVNAAKEATNDMANYMETVGEISEDIELQVENKTMTREAANKEYKNREDLKSKQFLNTNKTTTIDSFILDYMYEK